MGLKRTVKRIPVVGDVIVRLYRFLRRRTPATPITSSREYWEARYAAGDDSGSGSFGKLRRFKAEIINDFVREHGVTSVIEFGCGDGNQLRLAQYPQYLGLDVSATAIRRCQKLYRRDGTKTFKLMDQYHGERADLTLSLDVIYHLLEDAVFDAHLRMLFQAAERYVIIYSTNVDDDRHTGGLHVRHRCFTRWVEERMPHWRLIAHLPNRYPFHGDEAKGSLADFFIYQRA